MAHLKISPDFFKMEEREGFPVGELMKRNWAAQLQVLEDVRELCEKHDIKWFAYAGTALGAVRHKGFIPWDDDIDICMVGEDFIKFLYYAKDELDQKYIHLSPYDRGDWEQRTIFRIANADCMNFGPERMDEWFDCPLAIGTDIFPFYYVPRDEKKLNYILDLLTNIESLYQLNEYTIKHLKMGDVEAAKAQEDLIAASIIGLQQDTGFTFTGDRPLSNQLCMLFDQVCRFTVEDEADYVTRYSTLMQYRDWLLPKELFYEQTFFPFEMLKVPIPKDYDFYLWNQYGDNYMKPSRSGGAHDYPYFSKQIRVLDTKIEVYDWASKQGDSEHIHVETPTKQKLSESKNEKCVVLYYTSIREMIIYSEYVMGKIRDVLEYFKKNSDTMELYWCPGGFVDAEKYPGLPSADRLIPQLKEEYYKIIEEFKAAGFGICDESGNLNKAIDSCDMYYGDAGLLQKLFTSTGKPAFIQDYHTRWSDSLSRENVGMSLITFPDGCGMFEGKIKPEFADACYFYGDIGYGMASNMNGLFKIDRKEGTYEYLYFIKDELANGSNLYAKAIPFGEKIVFIPQAANNLVIYDPKANLYKEINVYVDIANPWCEKAKYADCVEYEGKLFLFGERYNFVMKVNPDTGEKTLYDTKQSDIVWMRHAAFREGGLVRLVSAMSKDILTFNLRKEQLFVQKTYSESKVMPRLKELAAEKEKNAVSAEGFKLIGNMDKYNDGAFEGFNGPEGMVIKEQDDWLSFKEIVKYVEWKKAK